MEKVQEIFEAAVQLFDERKYRDAIRVGRQLTKRWPRLHPGYCLIAQSYDELGRWKMAERFYRQALALKQQPEIWVLLSSALGHLGKNDEAEECLRQALKIDPDYEEAHYNLGYIYRQKRKFAPAEKHLKRAIEIDPKYALAYAELGQLLAGQKERKEEAVSLLKKAVAYRADDQWSRAYLANALWSLRKLKAAEGQYRRLLELWPDNPLPSWSYGDFLACESKNTSTAEKYLRKAVKIAPRDRAANYYLGKHLLHWDRKKEARTFLSKAARLGDSRARKLLSDVC